MARTTEPMTPPNKPVGDEQPVLAVEHDRVRFLQFTVAGTEFGKGLDELPGLVELHYAGVAEFRPVPFGNKDVAITRDGDTGWLIECVQRGAARALPGLPRAAAADRLTQPSRKNPLRFGRLFALEATSNPCIWSQRSFPCRDPLRMGKTYRRLPAVSWS
jgi:hypothetical protein